MTMMLRYTQLKHKPRTLLALTSVTADEFATLLPRFGTAWEAYVQEHFIQDKPRQRRYGAGRRPRLTVPPKSGPVVRYRPPVAAPAKAAATAGGGPRAGKYRILGTGGKFLLQRGYFVLSGGNRYTIYSPKMEPLKSGGSYRFDAASQTVIWLSGPYAQGKWGGTFQSSFEGAKHSIIINRAVTAENIKE